MADTTNDIWNDRDGEREAPPKRHILRNFLIFLLVLIAVLGVVLAAAWRDGTGFDVLRRYFTYGTVSGAGIKLVFSLTLTTATALRKSETADLSLSPTPPSAC